MMFMVSSDDVIYCEMMMMLLSLEVSMKVVYLI